VITVPCIQMVSPTHTNHNEHPRTSPIPLSNAKGTNSESVPGDTGARASAPDTVHTHARKRASTHRTVRTSNREMVICNLADKLPSVDWKIRRTSPEIRADRCRTSKDLESPSLAVITRPSSESATLLQRLICCLRGNKENSVPPLVPSPLRSNTVCPWCFRVETPRGG
jgi:hypothetical protein